MGYSKPKPRISRRNRYIHPCLHGVFLTGHAKPRVRDVSYDMGMTELILGGKVRQIPCGKFIICVNNSMQRTDSYFSYRLRDTNRPVYGDILVFRSEDGFRASAGEYDIGEVLDLFLTWDGKRIISEYSLI